MRPILEVDVQLLENKFVNEYHEGVRVLYSSMMDDKGGGGGRVLYNLSTIHGMNNGELSMTYLNCICK